MPLNKQQTRRYHRNIILDEIGVEGQQKLLDSKVLVIGVGGLGSPAAMYLAAAGIGTIGIADADKIELSNLQRQIIHHTKDLGVSKTDSASEKLSAINPDVSIRTYNLLVKENNACDIINEYDFVLDCTDNFESKFMINEACCSAKKPFSHAGILEFQGQLMTILAGQTACYRCVFDGPPPASKVAGVLGVLPGVIGSLQVTEAVKYLLDIGGLLTDTLLTYDALKMEFRKVTVKRNPNCPVCG